MEAKGIEDVEGFITFREYTRSQDKIKQELVRSQDSIKKELTERLEKAEAQHDKLDTKINNIDDKVDQVKETVLPLTAIMTIVADNTKEIAQTLKVFTIGQTDTNGMFVEKFHEQDLKITGLEHATSGFSDKKKYNLGVTAALIGLAGIFLGGLFNLAPILFGN